VSRRVAPIQRETLASYIRQLAWANHLPSLDLVEYLVPDGARSLERGWLIEQLAIAGNTARPLFAMRCPN
jgi:hypothetical protein